MTPASPPNGTPVPSFWKIHPPTNAPMIPMMMSPMIPYPVPPMTNEASKPATSPTMSQVNRSTMRSVRVRPSEWQLLCLQSQP